MMMAAILDEFSIYLRFCLKLRDITRNGQEIPFYVIILHYILHLSDKNAKYWKENEK